MRTDLFKSRSVVPPEAFTEIKGEALTWLKGLGDQTEDPHRTEMLRRLERVVSDWTFQDRRVEWFAAFDPLFPGRTQWLSELYNMFRDNRHGPAHGNFSSVTNRPPHTSIDALGRLAGFVNLIIAAQAGYKGPILESPYGNRRMELRWRCEFEFVVSSPLTSPPIHAPSHS